MISPKRRNSGQISIVRALSKLGHASRTVAYAMIRARRIAVNGRVITSPHVWLDLKVDRIALDGKPVKREKRIYLAMNKPRDVVTTRSDERHRKTVYDLLPDRKEWIFPIGRLDRATAGLLLFTNDVRFGEFLTNPDRLIPKTYLVRLDHQLREEDQREMERGMTLKDGTVLRGAEVRRQPNDPTVVIMIISEGKNRQIRRMVEELGYDVLDLVRTRIGPVNLGSLREGEARALTTQEVDSIMACGVKKESHDTSHQSHR